MYQASQAFHDAIANGNEQKALLIFADCVFSNGDINVENGIEFRDYFNLEENLAIGQATSNEILFSLFNDERLLNDYAFGDFQATLGVLVGTDTYQQFGSVMMTTNFAGWIGSDTYPFLKRNNAVVSSQPSFAVKSMIGYNGKVWAFSDDGRYAVYNDTNGENITSSNPVNAFMRKKSQSWVGKGMFYNPTSRILFIYHSGERERYEFVPFGLFTAERPKAPDVIQIDMTCNDFMMKFEEDMPSDATLGLSWPSTIGNLFIKMCNYAGVMYRTSTFMNSSAIISQRPEEFDSATMRDVLKWIAEAAGSNARFDRDGYLIMDWLRNTTQSMDATAYNSFDPCWYKTKKITKLYNQASNGSYEQTKGSGKEGYVIQDNPLLKGVS